jgi:transposase
VPGTNPQRIKNPVRSSVRGSARSRVRRQQIQELDRLIACTLEEITSPHDGPGAEPSAGGVSARALAGKLDAVPGIGPATAQIILAEIGADMSRFPTPEHLVKISRGLPR